MDDLSCCGWFNLYLVGWVGGCGDHDGASWELDCVSRGGFVGADCLVGGVSEGCSG